MTQPIVLSSGQIRQWGERRVPLVRTKAYAFSLDLTFDGKQFHVDHDACRAAAQFPRDSEHTPFSNGSRLFHVQDEVLIRSADGLVRDVPHEAQVRRANVFVTASATGGADLEARLLLEWQKKAFLSMEITGVLAPGGPLLAFWSARDKCDETIRSRISVRTECDSANFRWLVQNQLFGWGYARVRRSAETEPWNAEFTYDLYSMGG
jgi:hypothetical protein